jgi:uncharacterized protein YjbI with pentapeptide repeats
MRTLECQALVWTDLSRASFACAHLACSTFTGTFLKYSNFAGADCSAVSFAKTVATDACFRECCLVDADFTDADLDRASFAHANLASANMRTAKNLRMGALRGANLEGAELPTSITNLPFEKWLDEPTKAHTLMLYSLILLCMFGLASVAGTSDLSMFTTTGIITLPLISSNLSVPVFYLLYPSSIFLLYLFNIMALTSYWANAASLPAVFPNGLRVTDFLSPSPLVLILRRMYPRHGRRSPGQNKIAAGIASFLVWWLVLLTILGFWMRYLPRHHYFGSALHVLVLALATTVAITSARSARRQFRAISGSRALLEFTLWASCLLACITVFGALTYGAISGVPPKLYVARYAQDDVFVFMGQGIQAFKGKRNPIQVWGPRILAFQGFSTFANLRDQELSVKPASWSGTLEQVKGSDFSGQDLPFANFDRTFAAKANFRGTALGYASFIYADLREADFGFGDESYYGWGLTGRSTRIAVGFESSISLNNVDLGNSVFLGADMREAKLTSVNATEADFTVTDLRKANLTQGIFDSANFIGSDMRGALLGGASLSDAQLHGARLEGTDLSQVRGLTQVQIDLACMDARTKLPPGLRTAMPCSSPLRKSEALQVLASPVECKPPEPGSQTLSSAGEGPPPACLPRAKVYQFIRVVRQ